MNTTIRAGGVAGPIGSTDGNFAFFDGTTGRRLKDGGTPGDAAFKNTGTGTSTVAAGDDSRITGALQQGVHTLFLPASRWNPTITNGASRFYAEDPTNDLIEDALSFSTSTQQFATLDLVLPKRWNGGTVTFTPYWRTTGGGSSQTVQWGFSGVAVGNLETADSAPGTAQTSTDTWGSDAWLHVGPATAAITIAPVSTLEPFDMLRFKVSRNVASDDLASAARLQGALITITYNKANDA